MQQVVDHIVTLVDSAGDVFVNAGLPLIFFVKKL